MPLTTTILGIIAMSLSTMDAECRLLTDFTDEERNKQWLTVNDNVMGGRSDGGFIIKNGTLRFSGDINTNGGGFSSIRWPLKPGALEGYQSLRLKMKSDGRRYAVNFRGPARVQGRQIAYRGTLPSTGDDDWSTISLDFTELEPTIFGRVLRGVPAFEAADITTLGMIIADGIDGPFAAEIDSIYACS